MENVQSKTGKILEGIKKGEIAQGIIIRITDGIASDFMTEDQIRNRQVQSDEPFTEVEVGIPEKSTILKPFSFKDYTRIGEGGIPANSTMGKIMGVCDLEENGKVPLIAREVETTKNGSSQKFVTWEIAI